MEKIYLYIHSRSELREFFDMVDCVQNNLTDFKDIRYVHGLLRCKNDNHSLIRIQKHDQV